MQSDVSEMYSISGNDFHPLSKLANSDCQILKFSFILAFKLASHT